MKGYITHSEAETEALAEGLAPLLRPGDVLGYTGGMGMGKTAFTRGLARGLGIEAEVASPTFALVNEYRGERFSLYHFDMYRVESYEDLYSTGFFDYLEMGEILAVEWSENIWKALPPGFLTIAFERLDEETRKITIEGDDRF